MSEAETQAENQLDATTNVNASSDGPTQVPSNTYALLQKIPKICGPKGYLEWHRKVKSCFLFTRLWKYTQSKHPAEDEGNELCCGALKEVVEGRLFHTIENITVAKDAYDKIVKACKPKGSSAVFAIFRRFATLKLSNCSSINDYGDQFRGLINELNMLPTHPHMSEMWYIYQYFNGLGESPEALTFIDRWVLDHEPIDEDSDEPKIPPG